MYCICTTRVSCSDETHISEVAHISWVQTIDHAFVRLTANESENAGVRRYANVKARSALRQDREGRTTLGYELH